MRDDRVGKFVKRYHLAREFTLLIATNLLDFQKNRYFPVLIHFLSKLILKWSFCIPLFTSRRLHISTTRVDRSIDTIIAEKKRPPARYYINSPFTVVRDFLLLRSLHSNTCHKLIVQNYPPVLRFFFLRLTNFDKRLHTIHVYITAMYECYATCKCIWVEEQALAKFGAK